MKLKRSEVTAIGGILVALLCGTLPAAAQDPKTPYPTRMAPLEQYLMADRDAEIALARSAAPESIASEAEVLVLGPHGYETAVKGKNGFVCSVGRSWEHGEKDADFWSPKVRAPFCLNAAAARFSLPRLNKRTELALAGRSQAQISEAIRAGVASKELPPPEPGTLVFMMSKEGHINDRDGHWHPHLMFYFSNTDPATWGANLDGSPVIAAESALDQLITFMVPVRRWSDGTLDSPQAAH